MFFTEIGRLLKNILGRLNHENFETYNLIHKRTFLMIIAAGKKSVDFFF